MKQEIEEDSMAGEGPGARKSLKSVGGKCLERCGLAVKEPGETEFCAVTSQRQRPGLAQEQQNEERISHE